MQSSSGASPKIFRGDITFDQTIASQLHGNLTTYNFE